MDAGGGGVFCAAEEMDVAFDEENSKMEVWKMEKTDVLSWLKTAFLFPEKGAAAIAVQQVPEDDRGCAVKVTV